jgi:Asp-tRNA(Asn)/Glu-tRNA(Gln) amidotransferase C subunit
MKMLNKEEIKKLSRLCKIKFKDDEIEGFTNKLDSVLTNDR